MCIYHISKYIPSRCGVSSRFLARVDEKRNAQGNNEISKETEWHCSYITTFVEGREKKKGCGGHALGSKKKNEIQKNKNISINNSTMPDQKKKDRD